MDNRPWEKQEIASRFRALRRKALLTQLRLAGLIGIGRQAVNKIENARAMPHENTWNAFLSLETKHYQRRAIFRERWI
jgi:DNA-binding XRE family transcriptional regulator